MVFMHMRPSCGTAIHMIRYQPKKVKKIECYQCFKKNHTNFQTNIEILLTSVNIDAYLIDFLWIFLHVYFFMNLIYSTSFCSFLILFPLHFFECSDNLDSDTIIEFNGAFLLFRSDVAMFHY